MDDILPTAAAMVVTVCVGEGRSLCVVWCVVTGMCVWWGGEGCFVCVCVCVVHGDGHGYECAGGCTPHVVTVLHMCCWYTGDGHDDERQAPERREPA